MSILLDESLLDDDLRAKEGASIHALRSSQPANNDDDDGEEAMSDTNSITVGAVRAIARVRYRYR